MDLGKIKKEGGAAGSHAPGEEDELGFLHGMNLTNLVREFEMEATTGNGSQHLGILSLADDNVEEVFPELPEEEDEEKQTEAVKTDDTENEIRVKTEGPTSTEADDNNTEKNDNLSTDLPKSQ